VALRHVFRNSGVATAVLLVALTAVPLGACNSERDTAGWAVGASDTGEVTLDADEPSVDELWPDYEQAARERAVVPCQCLGPLVGDLEGCEQTLGDQLGPVLACFEQVMMEQPDGAGAAWVRCSLSMLDAQAECREELGAAYCQQQETCDSLTGEFGECDGLLPEAMSAELAGCTGLGGRITMPLR
jgi:hypothetical protein